MSTPLNKDVKLTFAAFLLLVVGFLEKQLMDFSVLLSTEFDPLSLEELVGIVTITTFLVGFSTVRQQTKLEDHRARVALLTDRVIEQNNAADLLPLPSGMVEHRLDDRFTTNDPVTQFTERLSVVTLLATSALIALQIAPRANIESIDTLVTLAGSHLGHLFVQLIHGGIVYLGFRSRRTVQKTADEDASKSAFAAYAQLEEALEDWLTCGSREASVPQVQRVSECCDNLDAALPEWAWLHLIRCSLRIDVLGVSRLSEVGSSSQFGPTDIALDAAQINLERIFDLAQKSRDVDPYSQIAYVWSAYLRDASGLDNASERVRITYIEKVADFLKRSIAKRHRTGTIMAEMALRDVRWALKNSKIVSAAPRSWRRVFDEPPIEVVFREVDQLIQQLRPAAKSAQEPYSTIR